MWGEIKIWIYKNKYKYKTQRLSLRPSGVIEREKHVSEMCIKPNIFNFTLIFVQNIWGGADIFLGNVYNPTFLCYPDIHAKHLWGEIKIWKYKDTALSLPFKSGNIYLGFV